MLLPQRLLIIVLPGFCLRRIDRRTPRFVPEFTDQALELLEPVASGPGAARRHMGSGGDGAGFCEEADVGLFLGRPGPVGVADAGADFGFALVKQVPVIERGQEALWGDGEDVDVVVGGGESGCVWPWGHGLGQWLVGSLTDECWMGWV